MTEAIAPAALRTRGGDQAQHRCRPSPDAGPQSSGPRIRRAASTSARTPAARSKVASHEDCRSRTKEPRRARARRDSSWCEGATMSAPILATSASPTGQNRPPDLRRRRGPNWREAITSARISATPWLRSPESQRGSTIGRSRAFAEALGRRRADRLSSQRSTNSRPNSAQPCSWATSGGRSSLGSRRRPARRGRSVTIGRGELPADRR